MILFSRFSKISKTVLQQHSYKWLCVLYINIFIFQSSDTESMGQNLTYFCAQWTNSNSLTSSIICSNLPKSYYNMASTFLFLWLYLFFPRKRWKKHWNPHYLSYALSDNAILFTTGLIIDTLFLLVNVWWTTSVVSWHLQCLKLKSHLN